MIYILPWTGEEMDADFAYVRCNESQKHGKMEEKEWAITRSFVPNYQILDENPRISLRRISFAPVAHVNRGLCLRSEAML